MRKIILLSMVLMISACSSWSTSNIETVEGYQANNINTTEGSDQSESLQDIIITESDMSSRNFTVVGDMSVTVNKTTIFNQTPTRQMVNEKLRNEAFKIGADAVILVRYGSPGMSLWSYGSLNGKGRAIVFLDK